MKLRERPVKYEELITQKYVNEIAYEIGRCAIEVHRNLGPGLLESIYQVCLEDELRRSELGFKAQCSIPITYKDRAVAGNLRLDLLVENLVVVELKAVEVMLPLYTAQLLSYLKLTGKPKGLLINFNCTNISKQLVPLVTQEFSRLPKE